MATIRDLLAAILNRQQATQPPPQVDGVDAARPWDSPILRVAPATSQAPPVASSGYTQAAPDPFGHAQLLAERQANVAKLASPMTPVLEVPADILAALIKKRK